MNDFGCEEVKLSKAFGVCFVLSVLCSFIPVAFSQTLYVTSDNQVKIGIFYYVWWWTEGYTSWDYSVVDTPVLSFYDSDNSTIISKQLAEIEALGIDFVIVSWWGTQDGFGRFTDMAAKQVFQVASSSQTKLKFAVLVEPFDIVEEEYDYAAIYNQIYNDFFLPYCSLYYYEDGKPLIGFYNDPGNPPILTDEYMPLDSRFTCRIIGEEPYTQWMYLDLVRQVVRESEVSVTPRYDESRLADRALGLEIDPQLDQGVYDYEWQKAIQLYQQQQIKTVLISSWNEYYERTEIEPHFDATAINSDPYFLYNKTKTYISQLRQVEFGEPLTTPNPSDTSQQQDGVITIPEYPSTVLWFMLLVAVTVSICVFEKNYAKRLR